ncbi:MAG: hypothetical protein FWF24_02220 [Alphaproteobacteria bacterium]|nr:hypothetical protein [Alphaproteobacteria bacterium]
MENDDKPMATKSIKSAALAVASATLLATPSLAEKAPLHDILIFPDKNPEWSRAVNEVFRNKGETEKMIGQEVVFLDYGKIKEALKGEKPSHDGFSKVLKNSNAPIAEGKINRLSAALLEVEEKNLGGFCTSIGNYRSTPFLGTSVEDNPFSDRTSVVVVDKKNIQTLFHEVGHLTQSVPTQIDGQDKTINPFLNVFYAPTGDIDKNTPAMLQSLRTNHKENMAESYAMIKMEQLGVSTLGVAEDGILRSTYNFRNKLYSDPNAADKADNFIAYNAYKSLSVTKDFCIQAKHKKWDRVDKILSGLQEEYNNKKGYNIIEADKPTFDDQEKQAILKELKDNGFEKLPDKTCHRIAGLIASTHSLTPEQIKDLKDAALGDDVPKGDARDSWNKTYYWYKDDPEANNPAFKPAIRANESIKEEEAQRPSKSTVTVPIPKLTPE